MKKSLFIALATLALVSQAHAQKKEFKSEGARRLQVKESAESAGKGGARAAIGADRTMRAVEVSKAAKDLSPSARLRLNEVVSKDPEALSLIQTLNAQSDSRPEIRDLASATLEGISNLKGIDRSENAQAIAQMNPTARADQAYATLVVSVVKRAIGSSKNDAWSAETRGVAESLLKKSNALIASGKSQGEALTLAAREVEIEETNKARAKDPKAPEFKLDIDAINKFCKG